MLFGFGLVELYKYLYNKENNFAITKGHWPDISEFQDLSGF